MCSTVPILCTRCATSRRQIWSSWRMCRSSAVRLGSPPRPNPLSSCHPRCAFSSAFFGVVLRLIFFRWSSPPWKKLGLANVHVPCSTLRKP